MYRFIQQNRKIRKDLDALRGTTVTVYISRTTSELTTFPDTGAGGGRSQTLTVHGARGRARRAHGTGVRGVLHPGIMQLSPQREITSERL